MFYSQLFQSKSFRTEPKYSTLVINSEYFPFKDVDDVKAIISEFGRDVDNLIIYTESVPVTARWMKIRRSGYGEIRLPGSQDANDIDRIIEQALEAMQDKFIYSVYFPSLTNYDNTHKVIRLLDDIDSNILYMGRPSIIVDYLVAMRTQDDYILNTELENTEYISVSYMRNKLSKWPSPATFVLMSHLIRNDFGHRIVEDLSPNYILSKPVSLDLFEDGRIVDEETYAHNLTMSMVEVMKDSDEVLSGRSRTMGQASSTTEFTGSKLELAIKKVDARIISKYTTKQANVGVSFLYLKLQYIASYLVDKDIDYAWTSDLYMREVYLQNVKFVYKISIVNKRGFGLMVKTLSEMRQKIRYQPVPINLYRTVLMRTTTSIQDLQFWDKFYAPGTYYDMSHYKSWDLDIMPRDSMIAIARANIEGEVIEDTRQEIVYSSMTVKPKTARILSSTEDIYTRKLPTTVFSIEQRRARM